MEKIRFVLAIFFLGSLAVALTTCAGPVQLAAVIVTPVNPSIPAGVTQQFTATGVNSDQTRHDMTTQVTWTSSNLLVATVNNSGLAITTAIGTSTITATSGSISGSTALTVTSG